MNSGDDQQRGREGVGGGEGEGEGRGRRGDGGRGREEALGTDTNTHLFYCAGRGIDHWVVAFLRHFRLSVTR